MEAKFLEIRDKATFMPALAVRISGDDGYIPSRAGYGQPMILLHFLEHPKAHYDAYCWGDRTKHTAHRHIEKNWDSIKNEDVIDVEFILGETTEPKKSERYDVIDIEFILGETTEPKK